MDDGKILKKIQDSAENVEVPESLKPEVMKKMLEEKSIKGSHETAKENQQEQEAQRKKTGEASGEKAVKKVIPLWRRHIAQAAAALVVLIGTGVLAGTGGLSRGNTQTETAELSVDASDVDSAKVGVESADAASETAGVGAEAADSGIQSVASYQELYTFLEAYQEAETSGLDTGAVYSAEMASEGMDTASSDTFNSQMESGESVSSDAAAYSDSADYSTTNIQEEGVDEADLVKTDGKYLYALGSDGTLRIIDAKNLTLTASLKVGEGTGDVKEIYLDDGILQVIRESVDYISVQGSVDMTDGSQTRSWYDYPVNRTRVITYDVSDPANPERQGTYTQDGTYLTSRRNGGYLYLFTSYLPNTQMESDEKEYFVPNAGGGLLPCEDIYYLGDKSEVIYSGGTFLVAGALRDGTPAEAADRMAVVGGGDTFYVSQENIYAAATFWSDSDRKTSLVRFGYEDGTFTPGSSCRLDGYLNDNFSMDEYRDHLRLVMTTDQTLDDGDLEIVSYEESNQLYILDENLEITGEIKNLGKGETIQSARFLGDTGYFVTYRNTDPLFSVDLSDPENPKVLDELKVTGFSSYLHAYGENLLLGLGWETDPDTSERLGLKCSLFDISDPSDVKETERLVLGDVDYCDAVDSQYKAILVNPDKNLFGFAYAVFKDDDSWNLQYYYGLFTYDAEKGIRALDYIPVSDDVFGADENYQNLRGLYIGDTFYLVGDGGVESYDMTTEDFRMTGGVCWTE